MRVVISQPMFFPWIGIFEQLKLADVWVHYDDVQFSKGSFTNRVQIKTAQGSKWITLPLAGLRLGDSIADVHVDSSQPFASRHLAQLAEAYGDAPFLEDMLAIAEKVYSLDTQSLSEIAISSFEAIADYFELELPRVTLSSELGVSGSGTQRVLDVVCSFGGTEYVTGHGAKNYLDHQAFEAAGVEVSYMSYACRSYPQLHGAFTPFVSALDLVANCGRDGREVITSSTVPWREFLAA